MQELSKEVLVDLLRTMILCRRAEEKLGEVFAQGQIPGFIHAGIGQEGVAAGVCRALNKDDFIGNTHRGHGQALAKGVDLKRFMAELFGKETGFCHGRSGSMHLADIEHGVLGAVGVVGGGIPIATGVAFGCQHRKTKRVVVCFFGEGATGTGAFHESVNLASVWNLPILYCCENNSWAEFTHRSIHMKISDVAERAKAYGIRGTIVDGDDVVAVYQEAKQLIEELRQGKGPILMECKTHRWHGHFEGDPQKYRPPEDIEACKQYCPIDRLKRRLLESGVATEEDINGIYKEIDDRLAEAVAFARESPEPSPETLLRDVYWEGNSNE